MTAAVAHKPAFRKPNATRAARRFREIVDGLRADLGRTPDTGEAALIDQAATLIMQRERLSAAMMLGEPIKSNELTKITGAVTRCLASLRGETSNAPATPSLAEYAAQKAAERARHQAEPID